MSVSLWKHARESRVACPRALPQEGAIAGGFLPLAHRLAILYLTLPLVIWLIGWLEWWLGAPAVLALAAGLRNALRGPLRVAISRRDLMLGILALAWVLALPAGGLVGGQHGDWRAHHSVFLDLVRGDWPTYVTDHLRNDPPLLRLYLGYYLPPALLGRWFGAAALNWAVPLWTWAGAWLLLALFTRNLSAVRAWLGAALVLVFFSGMDTVVFLLRNALFGAGEWSKDAFTGSGFATSPELPLEIDYQSHAMTFGNSPHHFLCGGLGTMLVIGLQSRARFLATIGTVLAACLFWSTLLTAGLVVLAVALVARIGVRPLLTWQNLVVAPTLGGVLVLYLTSGKVAFPFWWIGVFYESGARLALDLAIVYLCEFVLLAALLWRLRPAILRDPLFVASVALLLLLPWFCFGQWGLNELFLRASVPPLFLLSHHMAHALVEHWHRPQPARAWAFAGSICVLGVGALSAGGWHFGYALERRVPPFEDLKGSLLVDQSWDEINQRTAVPSAVVRAMLRDHGRRGAPLGDSLFRSALQPLDELFFWEERLIYVIRGACATRGDSSIRFLLRFHGSDETEGYETYHIHDFGAPHIYQRKGNDSCIFKRELPPHPVRRMTTGRIVDGRPIWLVEIAFMDNVPAAVRVVFDHTANRREAEYAALVSRTPVARAEWDVYLVDNAIAYAKQPCAIGETRGRFFLHAAPAEAGDAAGGRGGPRFANLDFAFENRGGAAFNGKCMVQRELPSHALRRLSTGQLTADGARAWQVEIEVPRPPPADTTQH